MSIRTKIFIAVVSLMFGKCVTVENYTLQFVQMIYRHGDRAPGYLYTSDPNPESEWPLGVGELTDLGRRQQYSLGKYFRSAYKDFYSAHPKEITSLSAESRRCLQSAHANLASFFSPNDNGSSFEEDYIMQPIPIFAYPAESDLYLGLEGKCPNYDAEIKKNISSNGKEFKKENKAFFKYLTKHSGEKIGYTGASSLFDTLMIEKDYGLEIPQWAQLVWDELRDLAASRFHFTYNSTLVQRLRAGPFLKWVKNAFNNKIKGNSPDLKFITYSSHDSNLGVITAALKNFQEYPIPYCATLIFELYSNPRNDHFVRLLYLNSTETDKSVQTPHILHVEGCSEFCPVKDFTNFIEPFSSVDIENECGIALVGE